MDLSEAVAFSELKKVFTFGRKKKNLNRQQDFLECAVLMPKTRSIITALAPLRVTTLLKKCPSDWDATVADLDTK
jgi:hypothetical protein